MIKHRAFVFAKRLREASPRSVSAKRLREASPRVAKELYLMRCPGFGILVTVVTLGASFSRIRSRRVPVYQQGPGAEPKRVAFVLEPCVLGIG